jgi:hypothetical protein
MLSRQADAFLREPMLPGKNQHHRYLQRVIPHDGFYFGRFLLEQRCQLGFIYSSPLFFATIFASAGIVSTSAVVCYAWKRPNLEVRLLLWGGIFDGDGRFARIYGHLNQTGAQVRAILPVLRGVCNATAVGLF